ncbi:adiponectin receptor protein-like protein [Dinothrombium tinctorium]|uniref:Adiponectin receptor protein-like protein n=1 Tax=Dinothrombium tinctorium TaxID=1965070 RepID=A0A3S3SI84_9ACAR|nr:adiponectin receptor protein-like protein [Dinothrombium tinctorium]RWS14172.1 adiponectin receptor protein-like protein [Dinothrombium tinctorium]RWS14458.1 adiponectin receptor protein-like protein [Dinothrombium tinctorium]
MYQRKSEMMKKALEKTEDAEKYVLKKLEDAWAVCHFNHLPQWLQDNDFLHMGHRPQLESFKKCFWSIFRLHTETANIWTHLIGCLIFAGLAVYFLTFSPHHQLKLIDKVVFGIFFAGAIVCLGLSSLYHMLSCHSQRIGKLFSRLDYCGIALLITGSFVPWLYYGFYCDYFPKIFYLVLVSTLGTLTTIVSLWEKFSEPNFRAIRASVFAAFGLSGVIPGVHWLISQNWITAASLRSSFICLISMGVLYITGAFLYASRIPERFFPGKCDYWFHSHQIFHILVIIAAIVHYQGISVMALHRVENMCPSSVIDSVKSLSAFSMDSLALKN